jgi:hypothetical protein
VTSYPIYSTFHSSFVDSVVIDDDNNDDDDDVVVVDVFVDDIIIQFINDTFSPGKEESFSTSQFFWGEKVIFGVVVR